jgi:hypothetical protein
MKTRHRRCSSLDMPSPLTDTEGACVSSGYRPGNCTSNRIRAPEALTSNLAHGIGEASALVVALVAVLALASVLAKASSNEYQILEPSGGRIKENDSPGRRECWISWISWSWLCMHMEVQSKSLHRKFRVRDSETGSGFLFAISHA